MKLLIDIDEDKYKSIVEMYDTFTAEMKEWGLEVIRNGKPLDQEPIFDKIRAEIDRQQKWLLQAGYTAYNVDIAFDAIKSVVAESEE